MSRHSRQDVVEQNREGGKVLTLYVDDPMGKRCEGNMPAARKAEDELGAKLVVLKKGSGEYLGEADPPPCPSAALDGRLMVIDGTVDCEQSKSGLSKQGKRGA